MKIAFLGDSLTEGWPGAAYLPRLARRYPGHELLNLGRAGDTVGALLARLRATALAPADLAFVWAGANDAVMSAWDAEEAGGWGWSERLARLRSDYQALLEWAAARAPIVVCVRPLVLEAGGSLWEAHAAEIGDVVAEVAGGVGAARTLDLRPAFAAAASRGGGPFTTDGVHLTDAGADVVAAAFGAAIEDIERGGPAAPEEGG